MNDDDILQAIAASIEATNEWLASPECVMPQPHSYRVRSVTRSSAHYIQDQVLAQDVERAVAWDWEDIYYRRVRYKVKSWMFALASDDAVGGLCYGQIKLNIDNSYVSIEYLERLPNADDLSGFTALISIHFLHTLASTLGVRQIRISQPFPELVWFYENRCGFTPVPRPRDGEQPEVEYMLKELGNA